MAQVKTNVQRILEKEKILYAPHAYASDDGRIDGVSVAEKLGLPAEKVYKTLVTRGASKRIFVFVLPVELALNLKAAAKAVGEKSIELTAVRELTPLTGYLRGGCSPIGMKKSYPTIVDAAALLQKSILVSAGRIGAQVELSPQDLARVCGCEFAAITQ